jgi:hypothetical protein
MMVVIAASMLLLMLLVPYFLLFVTATALLGLSVGVFAGVAWNSRVVGLAAASVGAVLGAFTGCFFFLAGVGEGSARNMEIPWYGGDLNNSLVVSAVMTGLSLFMLTTAFCLWRAKGGSIGGSLVGDAAFKAVKCPQCGRVISSQTASCSNCG